MMVSKRMRAIAARLPAKATYRLEEAVTLLQQCPPLRFDPSLEVSLQTSCDRKKVDQQVRGYVLLPHGRGKQPVITVLAQGAAAEKAAAAGADHVGGEELIDKLRAGWLAFDVLLTTPQMMGAVSRVGKILGPRGLMPTPKEGTVTADVAQATTELKAGRIPFKSDRHGSIAAGVGKLSFSSDQLAENVRAFIAAVSKAKPATVKGEFIRRLFLSATMGPGLKIDLHPRSE